MKIKGLLRSTTHKSPEIGDSHTWYTRHAPADLSHSLSVTYFKFISVNSVSFLTSVLHKLIEDSLKTPIYQPKTYRLPPQRAEVLWRGSKFQGHRNVLSILSRVRSALLSIMNDLLNDARSISEVWHAKFVHNSSPQFATRQTLEQRKTIDRTQKGFCSRSEGKQRRLSVTENIRNTDQSFLHHIQRRSRLTNEHKKGGNGDSRSICDGST